MEKRNQVYLLILLVFVFIAINYSFIDEKLEKIFSNYEGGVVERVIDGDTIVVNNKSIRLLGVNSPERGEEYYLEAKEFIEDRIFNKSVRFEFSGEKYDLYNRMLAYIIFDKKNINEELVELGLANAYFPSGRDRHYSDFLNAWKQCIGNNRNLCANSEDKCADCISLTRFDSKNEIIELSNQCSFDCDMSGWKIKDEGRKTFNFPRFVLKSGGRVNIITGDGINTEDILYWSNYDYIWTDSGDTLFLRDENNRLILWKIY